MAIAAHHNRNLLALRRQVTSGLRPEHHAIDSGHVIGTHRQIVRSLKFHDDLGLRQCIEGGTMVAHTNRRLGKASFSL